MNPIVYLTILFFGIVIFFLWYEIAVARRMRQEDEEFDRKIAKFDPSKRPTNNDS